MVSTLIAGLNLTRPLNTFLTFLSACVGALSAGFLPWENQVPWAALAAACTAAAGYIFNDLADVEIDRINRPDRPLPSGRIDPSSAFGLGIVLALSGLVLAFVAGLATGCIAFLILLLLLLYNRYLKRTPFWGNLLVALMGAAVFPFGALAGGSWGRAWIPAGFAFLFHLGRELLKDLEDIEGDAEQGARTLPLHWTAMGSALLTSFFFAALILFTLLPWFVGLYGMAYLIPVSLVNTILLSVGFSLLHQKGSLSDKRLSGRLKPAMLLGLLAIVLGEVYR